MRRGGRVDAAGHPFQWWVGGMICSGTRMTCKGQRFRATGGDRQQAAPLSREAVGLLRGAAATMPGDGNTAAAGSSRDRQVHAETGDCYHTIICPDVAQGAYGADK